MTWRAEVYIGEMRPWPDAVDVVRGRTGEAVEYVPERTCEDTNIRVDAWTCSACRCTLLLMFDDFGEPTLNIDGVASTPNHCPNCGRKVV